MSTLTGRERMQRVLERKPADRIGVYETFWNDTTQSYRQKGHIGAEETLQDNLNLDMRECWCFNMTADIDFVPEILEETEETRLIKDGNGAILRRHKQHDATPEHVDYTVQDREGWLKVREMLVNIDERRINFKAYRQAKADAAAKEKFFVWSGVNVFEMIHPLCGHEYMLYGMADDPEWIEDMVKVYIEATLQLQEILFAKEGKPDGIMYYEDMGFKNRPFMSPSMYRELIWPAHKLSIDFAHQRGLPVIMHSCGFIEPLLPDIVEAGLDCLQVIEIKAGMDLLRVYQNFGEVLSLMGGIDVRTLYSNDKAIIDKELEAKIPIVKQGHGYCLHSDHSIPNTVNYETLKYFHEKALSL